MNKKTSKKTSEPSIEESIEELSKIEKKINSGTHPLEETVEMFTKAMNIYKKSKKKLDELKSKVIEASEEEIYIDEKNNQE